MKFVFNSRLYLWLGIALFAIAIWTPQSLPYGIKMLLTAGLLFGFFGFILKKTNQKIATGLTFVSGMHFAFAGSLFILGRMPTLTSVESGIWAFVGALLLTGALYALFSMIKSNRRLQVGDTVEERERLNSRRNIAGAIAFSCALLYAIYFAFFSMERDIFFLLIDKMRIGVGIATMLVAYGTVMRNERLQEIKKGDWKGLGVELRKLFLPLVLLSGGLTVTLTSVIVTFIHTRN